MKAINKYQIFSFVVLVGLLFSACEDQKARFDPPTWLGGSNIEVLEENEDYSIFLELMKRSGFYDAVSTINYTLFVPNDSAFEAYFAENGIADTSAMTDEQAYQLISLHVLVNPRSRYDLIYELLFGDDASERETEISEYTSLAFKKKTQSVDPTYKDILRYDTTETFVDSVVVYTGVKYIPIWSKEYLEDIFVPASGSDYEFLYGTNYDSESALSNLATNVSNAQLLPNPDNSDLLGINTSTGFIYPISEVIKPLPTIEKYLLANQDKYGLYYDLLQRFASFGGKQFVDVEVDGATVSQTQYKKSYTNSIPNVALERGPRNDYGNFDMIYMYTAFIPQDAILQEYLDTKLLPVYGTIDNIPAMTLSYLLRSHLNNNMILLSQMEDGFFDNFGSLSVLTESEVNSAVMCSNGPLYDISRVMVPNAFTAITEELFFNDEYSTFLFMLDQMGLISSLSTDGDKATFFASTNDELYDAGIRYNEEDEWIEYYGFNNQWNYMSTTDFTEFVGNHITFEKYDDLSGEGFLKMNSGNYLYYNNGVLQGPENQFLDEYCTTDVVKETDDGVMYHTNVPIKSRNYTIAKLLHNDTLALYEETLTDTTLTEFSTLLADNRLLNYRSMDAVTKELTPTMNFLSASDTWTVFAPTNEAIREARAAGLIPSSRDSLQKWIYYHFVPDRIVFDDGDADGTGTFATYLEGETIGDYTAYETLTFNNALNNLQITDKTGQVVTVDHSDANMLAQKGVVHKVNKVLRAW